MVVGTSTQFAHDPLTRQEIEERVKLANGKQNVQISSILIMARSTKLARIQIQRLILEGSESGQIVNMSHIWNNKLYSGIYPIIYGITSFTQVYIPYME